MSSHEPTEYELILERIRQETREIEASIGQPIANLQTEQLMRKYGKANLTKKFFGEGGA